MFDFEKLEVYGVARELNQQVLKFIFTQHDMDPYIRDQWKRCSIGAILNLSEGAGRVTDADKKHFFTMARGSVFESVTLLQLVRDMGGIDQENYQRFYDGYERLSKMLLGMYRSKA